MLLNVTAMKLTFCSLLAGVALAVVNAGATADPFANARAQMLEAVQRDFEATRNELGQGALDTRVTAALAAVPRHEFVAADMRKHAYENRPLPIGYGQTISQPYVVAAMTQLLQLRPGERALEIGTGSGYQAAILAELGAQVFTIEIIQPLGEAARERLKRLGYERINTHIGDGYDGWPARAPFDAIIVTAAAKNIPSPLLEQLKVGGRMVIPVGSPFGAQQLLLVRKDPDGRVTTRKLLPVRFVPLTGRHGEK
jgi:protein-L-isoaspartate(D-aspartate) O-methyltransferase